MTSLFLVTLVFLVVILWAQGFGLRRAFAAGCQVQLGLVVVITESASAFQTLDRETVAAAWLVLAVAGAALAGRAVSRGRIGPAAGGARGALTGGSGALVPAGVAAAMLALIVTAALAAPPNTWDSMTYHMARVSHWIQQSGVGFFPTAITRQNEMMPLAEFAILHLQLLSGSDAWANLVQTVALGMAAAYASLIVEELAGPPRAQALAVAFAATLPTAVLQASSTQNDLLTAALCLGFAYELMLGTRLAWRSAVAFAGLSFGLALLTKATAYLFCAGVGLALGVGALLSPRSSGLPRREVGRRLAIVVILGLAVNAGHLARIAALYGHVLPPSREAVLNEAVSARAAASNAVRNVAQQLGTPWPAACRAVEVAVQRLLGDAIEDPRTTFPNARFRVRYSTDEDLASNALHTLLAGGALLATAFRRPEGPVAAVAARRRYAAGIVLAGLLYCVLLRWQPYGTRLQAPLLLLAAPLVGLAFGAGRRWRHAPSLLAVLMFAGAVTVACWNEPRPLLPTTKGLSILRVPRQEQYFRKRPRLEASYVAAMSAATRDTPDEIGLVLGDDDWEYPLWVLAGSHASRRPPRLRHVLVENASHRLGGATALPDVIVATRPMDVTALGARWGVAFGDERVRVFRRRAEAASPAPGPPL